MSKEEAKKQNNKKEYKKTELVWPDKKTEVEHVELPFQTIETINLPRGHKQEDIFSFPEQQKIVKGKKEQERLKKKIVPDTGWKNRLIWGDNLLVMGSLLKEFAGKINLIYIDPPFATGSDFSFQVKIGDQEITKEPSALEVKAYRDTWGRGLESYLQMMYDRLVLMKELLTDDGSIYIHCDWRVESALKLILDEIFGGGGFDNKAGFRNRISWRRENPKGAKVSSHQYPRDTDTIFFYTKTSNWFYNNQFAEKIYSIEEAEKNGFKYDKKYGKWFKTSPRGDYTDESIKKLEKEGRIYKTNKGNIRIKYWIDFKKGKVINRVVADDLWDDIPGLMHVSKAEKVDYPTQKPSALLERIIKASSEKDDIIADFFCGSGTTGVVAEKLGRRWMMSDLGRFAINTSRKRLLDISSCKPFVVQNLGKYERHRWVHKNGTLKDYIKFILELYRAEQIDEFKNLHGKKGNIFVRIGAVDAPVTLSEITTTLEECKINKIKELDILGWEWEMGLHDLVVDEAKKYGVKLKTLQIPREVMELSIKDKNIKEEVQFFELAYLDAGVKVKDKATTVTLKDFIIPNPELLPDEVRKKVKNWSDYIDYWSVDWMFNQHPDKWTEEDDTFHNMNQCYRTHKEPKLELSMKYDYKKKGKYNLLVKVIDIFGNDTTKLIELRIK